MSQQTIEINNTIGSTIVGGSIAAVAAFLGGLIAGQLGMAAAGTAAAIIVSKYIKREKISVFYFILTLLTIIFQSQRSVLCCQSLI